MKKWIIVLLALCILLIGCIYFFIPSAIRISSSSTINANPEATYRLLLDEKTWKKWWPAKQPAASGTTLFYEGSSYQINKKLFNAFVLEIIQKDQSSSSQLILLPLNTDSLVIEWSARITTTSNPFNKLNQYFKARFLKKNMSELLYTLKSFLERHENVYGILIRQTKVNDSVLVAMRMITSHRPTTQNIYSVVQTLKAYIKKNGAREIDYPMLNIDSSSGQFNTMIGIPTDKLLPGDNKNFFFKRMFLGGNILAAEVTGGPHTVKEAFRQMQLYVEDHNMQQPAIPFASLITDRSKQPDTSKWVTQIYFPIY